MKNILCFILLCAGLLPVFSRDYTEFVNPLVGTQSTFELSAGNTYPAIARPWGMNFWTPQTGKMGDGWQYTYTANRICGFKQTHQPSPWMNDYGQFSIMPITGAPVLKKESGQVGFHIRLKKPSPTIIRFIWQIMMYWQKSLLLSEQRCFVLRFRRIAIPMWSWTRSIKEISKKHLM